MELKKIDDKHIIQDGEGNIKITITKNSVYSSYKLFDVRFSDGTYLASVIWMGSSLSTGEKILQPAIVTNRTETTYLSYDGRANFIDDSELIVMPENGSQFSIEAGVAYYFRNSNPKVPNSKYYLGYNNKSIRMNNISIFNSDFSRGAMLDFRASMEGSFSDPSKKGYIVVLATIDEIN